MSGRPALTDSTTQNMSNRLYDISNIIMSALTFSSLLSVQLGLMLLVM